MKLLPGFAEEYKQRHDAIWPELKALLSESGIRDYSIYLDEATHTLFAVQKLAEGFDPASLPGHPLVKKWWAYMADIMQTHPDNAPVEGKLKEMFHMD